MYIPYGHLRRKYYDKNIQVVPDTWSRDYDRRRCAFDHGRHIATWPAANSENRNRHRDSESADGDERLYGIDLRYDDRQSRDQRC